MPGTGSDAIIRHGNLVDVAHINSDSTYSECGRSPTFSSSQSDAFSFESDLSFTSNGELEYGPGIVNKLKSRFIHLTLKESERANNMIPLTNGSKMRRYASLEGLADSNPGLKPTINGTENQSGNRSHYYQNYNLRRSNMKKARSMDNLGSSHLDRSIYSSMTKSNTYDCDLGKNIPILINDNLVIIESITKVKRCDKGADEIDSRLTLRRSVVEPVRLGGIEVDEMPKPDTVKTFKQMFEAKKSSDKQSSKPIFKQSISKQRNKVSDNAESAIGQSLDQRHAGSDKLYLSSNEAIGAKSVNNELLKSNELFKDASAAHKMKERSKLDATVDESKLLKDRSSCSASAKQSDDSVIKNPDGDSFPSDKSTPSLKLPLCEIKDTPHENGDLKNKAFAPKLTTDRSIFGPSDSCKPLANKTPKVISVHAKAEDRPIANIKPIVNAQRNDNQRSKLMKEKIDLNGGKESLPIVNGKSDTEEKLVHTLSSLPKPRTWHKAPNTQASVVFDFRARKDVKPHISNKVAPFGCCPARPQGININGIDGEESCDYDDEDNIDSYCGDFSNIKPCDVEFEGAHIIIGKSAILANRNKQVS